MAYKDVLSNLIALMRIREWLHKFQELFIASLILLLFQPDSDSAQLVHPTNSGVFEVLLIFWIYQCFLLCYGYVINSYADREQDSIVGKHPEASFFSTRQLRLILSFLAIFSLGIPLYYGGSGIKVLGLTTFFLATFYSLRPIRFKERDFVGILVATAFQRPLLFLFFPLLIPCDMELFWILLGWIIFLGLTLEIAHQLDDFDNDVKAGVFTWATKVGKAKVKKGLIFTTSLLLFFICIPAFIFTMYEGLTVLFTLLVFSVYTLFFIIMIIRNA